MTTTHERTDAVKNLRDAAYDAVVSLVGARGQRVLIDRHIIERMQRALRHYPTDQDLLQATKKCPDVFK